MRVFSFNHRETGGTILEDLANPLLETDHKGTQIVNTEIKCYEADRCTESETNRTLVGDHDSRVSDAATLVAFVKTAHPRTSEDPQGWAEGEVAPTLNEVENHTEARATVLPVAAIGFKAGQSARAGLGDEREVAATIGAEMSALEPTVAEVFTVCSENSNAMKSKNPESGVFRTEIARTLDTSGSSPACNQGGDMVVEKSNCLTPHDSQTKRIYSPDGAMATLCRTPETTGQAAPAVCIALGRDAIEQGGNAQFKPEIREDGSQPTLTARGPGGVCIPIEGNGQRASHHGDGYGKPGDPSFTLNTVEQHGVAIGVDRWNQSGHEEVMPTVRSAASDADGNDAAPTVATRYAVRRLTPTECERLMGFPDGHTRIPWRGRPAEECPDGPRYKACGNSMCVNVMRWIGERIMEVEDGGEEAGGGCGEDARPAEGGRG